MNTVEKTKPLDGDYIVTFRNILKEAEKRDREAMARFRAWSAGTMDPAEAEAYTSAVKECAGRMKKESA